jgi:hypothetical protein
MKTKPKTNIYTDTEKLSHEETECLICGEDCLTCLELHQVTHKELKEMGFDYPEDEACGSIVLCSNCHMVLHAGELFEKTNEFKKACLESTLYELQVICRNCCIKAHNENAFYGE